VEFGNVCILESITFFYYVGGYVISLIGDNYLDLLHR